MATAQNICKGDGKEPLFNLKDNQAYWAITKAGSFDNFLTIRESKWICEGDKHDALATFRDGKWLYKGEGYEVLYTLRDNSSSLVISTEESYESYYTIRDNGSYIAICKTESLTPEYCIRGGSVSNLQMMALLVAVGALTL